MPLTRSPHWATQAYHQFLVDRSATPFKYGVNDCCLFCADGIEAMTGVDIDSDFRGKYTDAASALAVIAKVTGIPNATIEDGVAFCAAKHGLVEWKYPLMAQRGDLIVLEDSGNIVAGLVHLSGRDIVVAGEDGLKRLPITSIKRAWHV